MDMVMPSSFELIVVEPIGLLRQQAALSTAERVSPHRSVQKGCGGDNQGMILRLVIRPLVA